MVELGKQYRTRDGREVRIYATDAGGRYSVHGAVKSSQDGYWWHHTWTADGNYGGQGTVNCDSADLIEVKPKTTRTYWLVHFSDTDEAPEKARVFADEDQARYWACTRIASAITGPHEITFSEGDGL